MIFALAALALLTVVGILSFGAGILRSVLPKNHPVQTMLSEEAVSGAIAWTVKSWRMLFGCVLLGIFTVITIVYS